MEKTRCYSPPLASHQDSKSEDSRGRSAVQATRGAAGPTGWIPKNFPAPLAFSAMLSSSLFFQSVYQIPAALLGSSLLPKLIS